MRDLLSRRALSLALAGLLGSSGAPTASARGFAQEPPPDRPVFGVQAAAVLVDVVVRDKKGRLVKDLTAADFEVYEDGMKQAVDSFRVVDNHPLAPETAEAGPTSAPAAATPARATPAASPAGPPSVIAFVFDRLSPQARALARKAALDYTQRAHVPGDLVAVYGIDLALRTLQAFTVDVDRVRQGLEQAGGQANTVFAAERAQAREREESLERNEDALGALGGGGGNASGAGSVAGALATQAAVQRAESNILRAFDAMERDQQGFATTHGLMAVVNGLKSIPGRKTVVFFSEGLALPANVLGQFRSVIAAANRANVSVYAIDAGGLRTESGSQEARDEVVRNARTRVRQEETAGSGRGTREALSRGMERSEGALRLNPESGLGQLADETGGFLVSATNDLRSGFGRIAEDMRFYYLLSYAPTNDKLDGAFRTISVKVSRPDVRVQTRKGYFAVRPEYVLPVRGYEAAALAQLDRSPRPDAVPIAMAALSFPEPDRPGLVPVLVSVPGTALSWSSKDSPERKAEFSVVVRIKDRRGREADRLSQDYHLSVRADKLESARSGDILFYREAELPPGTYTAEAVAYDANSQQAGVRTAAIEVPAVRAGRLRLSSLVLVSRVEKLTAAEQGGKNPLHYGEAILYPSLGTPFRKSATPALGFYFSVYGAGASAPRATIEVDQGERVVARTVAELPAADGGGRIQHAGAVPLKGLAPGSYVLKVSVTDGASTDGRRAAFDVEE